jgi:cytoplasmic iron level regulating protein YaaA (DUF328/UPF0246 family)
VLIILPPSETKRPAPATGPALDLGQLAFPELNSVRARILDALIATSGELDAFERLRVGHTLAREVARNTHLREIPTLPAQDVYTGPVHEGFEAHRLSPRAADRAAEAAVVVSPLWGLIQLDDRIPPYRLHLNARLVGVDRIDLAWRAVLPGVLAEVAGPDGPIVDLRSPFYQQMGMPAASGDRVLHVRIDQGPRGARVGEVISKRARGAAARHLLESVDEPRDVDEVAAVLAMRWPVRLQPSDRPGRGWTLTVSLTG